MDFDLTTSYLGLTLRSPVVASAGPVTSKIDNLVRLDQCGVGAAVLPSLFEEDVEADDLDSIDRYLGVVASAVEATEMPIIASLNGTTTGFWTTTAALLQDAGAAAIELNIYHVAADPLVRGADVEDHYLELLSEVRSVVDLPLAVKVGPQFSSLSNMAQRLVAAGADGLVLFNRFYQPDIDLAQLTVEPRVELSSSAELRFIVQWVAILRSQLSCSLAATTGVHTGEDVVKCVLAGADVAMTTSALLANGPEHAADLVSEAATWLAERRFSSIDEARGSLSQDEVPNPGAFERANYGKTLSSFPRPN